MQKLSLVLWLAVSSAVWAADQPPPAFAHPDVLKAALAIEMTEEQQLKFRDALTTFYEDRMSALNRLMRGHNQTDVERKFKVKTRSLLRKMRKEMQGFLTEEQWPAYEHYEETLAANLRGM